MLPSSLAFASSHKGCASSSPSCFAPKKVSSPRILLPKTTKLGSAALATRADVKFAGGVDAHSYSTSTSSSGHHQTAIVVFMCRRCRVQRWLPSSPTRQPHGAPWSLVAEREALCAESPRSGHPNLAPMRPSVGWLGTSDSEPFQANGGFSPSTSRALHLFERLATLATPPSNSPRLLSDGRDITASRSRVAKDRQRWPSSLVRPAAGPDERLAVTGSASPRSLGGFFVSSCEAMRQPLTSSSSTPSLRSGDIGGSTCLRCHLFESHEMLTLLVPLFCRERGPSSQP